MNNGLSKQRTLLPSILSADFTNLAADVLRAEKAGSTIVHLDVMDGHFVPNITFGPGVVKALNAVSDLMLDTHLMIESPDRYLEAFRDAGADILTVHVEACPHLHRTVSRIRELGMFAGVSINPATSLTAIQEILPYVDLVLVMSVNPGFGSQKFIPTSIRKIETLRGMLEESGSDAVIEVDGGVDLSTANPLKQAGVQYFVAGNAVFGDRNIESNIQSLQKLIL